MQRAALLSLCVALSLCAEGYGFSATAVFNTLGVSGWVTFTRDEGSTDTVVYANVAGLPEGDPSATYNWWIARFPVLPTLESSERGTEENVGGVFDYSGSPLGAGESVGDLGGRLGQIPPDGTLMVTDDTGAIILSGENSIVGRSVVVQVENTRIAATIFLTIETDYPPPKVTTYTATFFSPVAGTVYFRQVNGSTDTAIFGSLYYVNDVASTTPNHRWGIRQYGAAIGYQANVGCTAERLGEIYNPTSASDMDPDFALGNLEGKFESIEVSASPIPYSDGAFFFTDTNLPLGGVNDILGRSLTIYNSDDSTSILACAPIVTSETLYTGQANDRLLTIWQDSPYENSTLRISEDYPPGNPDVAVLQDAFMTNGLCPRSSQVYNPFGVSTTEGGLTPDLFPLGDIPNKYNLDFMGPTDLELSELSLYGPNTFVGRTLQIVKESNDVEIRSCSALVPPKDEYSTLLVANFLQGQVRGGVYMFQSRLRDGTPYLGVTNVVVDLYYAEDDSMSQDHNWIISETSCDDIESSTPSVYNPFNVVQDPQECSNLNQERCAVGDMSGKNSPLALSSVDPLRPSYSFIDSNIDLTYNYSVDGMSLIIMGSGGSSDVLACASLNKRYLSEDQYDAYFSTPVSMDFDRVDFVNRITSYERLNGVLPSSNIIILNEVVGDRATSSGTACATFRMMIIALTTEIANDYASITQMSLCNRYSDDECFRSLSDFADLCPDATTTEGAPGLRSGLGVIFIGAVLAWLTHAA